MSDYSKWFTGDGIITNTIGGLTPPGNDLVPDADANYSSATITASSAITMGSGATAVTYAAGDILAYTDGRIIYNSLNAVMAGDINTGGVRSMPQSVSIVRVPDVLCDNISERGSTDKRGKLFWVFSNNYTTGIRVGLIDFTGTNGRGVFSNYSSSGMTPAGGALGTLLGSETGVDGRMLVVCKPEQKGIEPTYIGGFWVIARSAFDRGEGSGGWADEGWRAWSLNAINTNGFPRIDSGPALNPTVTTTGGGSSYNYTGNLTDAPAHGILSATPTDGVDGTSTAVKNYKVATIWRDGIGDPTDPNVGQVADRVEIWSFDSISGSLFNPTFTFTGGNDNDGPIAWPHPSGAESRYYNMYTCWSHNSTDADAVVYSGAFSVATPTTDAKLSLRYYEINNLNVIGTNGLIDVNDPAGNNIWTGDQHNSRIIGGIWRDPNKAGRIFISTPRKEGNQVGAVGVNSMTWSTDYPEIWGFDNDLPNAIQHVILENADDPQNATISTVGTLEDVTYYRYGAPQFTPCTVAASASNPPINFIKCQQKTYIMDTANDLWTIDLGNPQTVVNRVTNIPLDNFTGLNTNQYTDMMHIWDLGASSNQLFYWKFNQKINVLTNKVEITGANLALWDVTKMRFAHVSWTVSGTPTTTPLTSGLCSRERFFAQKAGAANLYAFGEVNTTANTASAYSAISQLDISLAFGGAISTKPLVAVVSHKDVDLTTTDTSYIAFGDRIVMFNHLTNAYAIVTAPTSGTITSLMIHQSGANTYLYATSGAPGSQIIELADISGGAGMTWASQSTSIVTDPGSFVWTTQAIGSTPCNAWEYFNGSWLQVPSSYPNYSQYAALCDPTIDDVINMSGTSEHVGCFQCVDGDPAGGYHLVTEACEWNDNYTIFPDCRFCDESFTDDCVIFYPCCNVEEIINNTANVLGPIELPGVTIANPGSYAYMSVHSVSTGGATPTCSFALTDEKKMWMSMSNGQIMNIQDIMGTPTGITNTSAFSSQNGSVSQLEDIAFDKHGNILCTTGTNSIGWASGYTGTVDFVSPLVNITNSFSVPLCLDTDYSAVGQIIGGDNIAGVATFRKYTNSLASGITLVSTITNNTITVGQDLSVDYNSGDYYVLGDPTGGAVTNSLISVDNANGNHTTISDLAVVCSFAAGQNAAGIERVRSGSNTSDTWVVSYDGVPGNYQIYLHKLDDTGTVQSSVVGLLNPFAGNTNNWLVRPTGLAFSDVCSKWPNNVDPNTTPYTDCQTCLNNPSTEDCCYKLTNCDTGAIQYSQQALLDPYVGSVIRLQGDTCWYVEKSLDCNSPVSVVPAAAPGPYSDCAACEVPPTVYYKLPKCGDPSDVVYTDNSGGATSTPLIDNYFTNGFVVNLNGECFCREIQINATGPQGTEAALNVQNTQVDCANCIYYLKIENCVTGAITNVDYASSPTLHPFIGSSQAHEITVGGVPLTDCHKVLVGCLGPTTITYPTASITASHTDCAACATAGQTCVKVEHCCGDSYVTAQIVNVTTGITAADIGSVVQADITVGGIIYTGCWTVSSNPDCVGMLPDADVNAISTATVGAGNMPDCTYCPVSPCDPQCTLLESCTNPGTTITVSGGLGSQIGSDVVELSGQTGCWKQCLTSGNPIAGTNWFYGDRLGIDFSSGAAVLDFNGQSTMLNYNSVNGPTSDAYTFRGAAVHSATGAATIGGHAFAAGDLMFYTDGHWIYDRTHNKMNLDSGPVHEGDANHNLVGDDSKTFPAQGAVVIPNAAGGVTNNVWHQYYVIQNSCGPGPIKWSLVDMTLNSGKGEVLAASANTTLVASATEMMCVNTTTGQGSSAYWHFFYVPVMSSGVDNNNQNISAIKFDSTGIGTSFIAVDVSSGLWNGSVLRFQSGGELLVNQTNDIIAMKHPDSSPNNATDNWVMRVFGLNPVTALSSTAMIGLPMSNGWNGGAQNGAYSWIIGGTMQDQQPTVGPYAGDIGINKPRTIAFSADGETLFASGASYYDPNDPYNIDISKAGWSFTMYKIKKLAVDFFNNGFFVWSGTTDGQTYDTDPTMYLYNRGDAGNFTNIQKTFPDASSVSGWLGGNPPDETRCNTIINDLAMGPDGRLWLNAVEQTQNNAYQLKVGGGNQVTNSVITFTNPTSALSIEDQLLAVIPVASFDLGNRPMGERFPTYLNMPCPCDPANVINPDPVITATHTDCTDCAPAPGFCYKLTECECTGGTSGPVNQCSVNDPATMPPNMITYGKTWSPTCINNVPQRWSALTNAIQALGTTAAPGIAQTVTFSYSFVNGGATFPNTWGGLGPALAVEQGPGTANPTGVSSTCNTYNKTYTITHVQFRAEMATMFAEIKAMLEGMFNTNCGYGANLTVNFTDLGYETGYTAGDPAMGTNTIASSNGTSFTDSNGVAGIGDFRIGFSDFGVIDGSCGNTGAASSILGLCFTGNLNANDPGNVKSSPEVGLLLFDANEDWRKASDPVVANSFSLIRVGIHEILHAFGYGHDYLTFGPLAGNCDCPCYQSDPTCPNLYPAPAGVIPNSDALMGPFSSSNHFATDFPTGLMGPEGIYDRRATCGIYGNSNANYACEDGTCLQPSGGCTYITEYSDDPALAAYVGGIITWDNGDPAGERCWTVEIENPCPGGVTLINPVNLVSGDPTGDCTDCDLVDPCYTLNLCSCDTSIGAPASIITNTDLSAHCNGTIGNGTIVEIAAYPGACYEIDCTPQPCPSTGAVAVTITNTYVDCNDCCVSNQTCYQLCPCNSNTNSTCSGQTQISSTITGYSNNYQAYSVNTPTDAHGTKKLISGVPASQSNHCVDPLSGNLIVTLNGIFIYKCGTLPHEPLDGMTNTYWAQTESWDTVRAELVAAGYGNATMDYNTMITWLNNNYVGSDGLQACHGINGGPCSCTSTCTVVTNDLSAEVGQVVTLGGAPSAPLNTTECYEVQVCGTCGTGSCNPTQAVVINTVHPTCPDCEGGTGCMCYKLVDCSDPSVVINNVCQSTDLDNAYINGDIIQINGNTQTCWEVHCDDIQNCDPGTCLSVAVTATFASCAACLGSQQWECVPTGGCNCVPSAGAGYPSEAACLASAGCCPNPPSWDCDPITGTCFDPGTGNGQYASVQACIQDCGTPESYNCIYDLSTNSYSCSDPGDGTGVFATLAACNSAVSSNTAPCYVESYNCVLNNGITQCVDPGDGTGTFNNTNGGLVACQGCNGCPEDPTCAGVTVTYDCDPVFGCIPNYTGTGQYPTLQDCAIDCASYEPGDGTFEGDCENCLTEVDMKKFFDKVADVCNDCNVPFGLTDQEVTCDTPCFGNSNIYVFLDITSTFGGTFLDKLQGAVQFKTDVLEPAFQQLQQENPTYTGHLYILPGAWPHGSQFGPCNNCNNTGAAAPGSATAPEDWLAWTNYPLSGNAGANGAGANPMATGTLPPTKRTVMGHTMVDGIGGAPFNCNGGAYNPTVHGPLLEQLMILPGFYPNDGFNQVNPWQDPAGKEGFSDPYHEFEGGDNDAICIIFQDESRPGYYEVQHPGSAMQNAGGSCGDAKWAGVDAVTWNSQGTNPGNTLTTQWKTDYDNHMSLHEFGWDTSGNPLPQSSSHNVTQKVMLYAGSYIDHNVSTVVDTRRDFLFHMMAAVGAQSIDAEISYNGHIDCADYVDIPTMYGFQVYAATDTDIPNPYMGASGGGDPTHTTGYQGGSLSNYGMTFHVPSYPIGDLSSTMLYNLWKDYLSNC